MRQDAGISTDKDFDGKIIATPQMGNTQDVAARIWFAEHGYKLKEKGGKLNLLPLSNPDQLTMFQKKEIHGAWTIEPWLSRLELEGGGRLFLDEKTLWPKGRYVTTHLIVSRKFLAANPGLVEKLLQGLVEVTQEINADKTAAAKILNAEIKQETGKALSEAVMTRSFGRVELTWDPIAASLRRSAEAAHQVKFLRQPPVLDGHLRAGHLEPGSRGEAAPTRGRMMRNPAPVKLRIVDVTKTFESASQTVAALHRVNLEVHQGEYVVLFGPSGVRQVHAAQSGGGVRDSDHG